LKGLDDRSVEMEVELREGDGDSRILERPPVNRTIAARVMSVAAVMGVPPISKRRVSNAVSSRSLNRVVSIRGISYVLVRDTVLVIIPRPPASNATGKSDRTWASDSVFPPPPPAAVSLRPVMISVQADGARAGR
jgi:hypothetical protein